MPSMLSIRDDISKIKGDKVKYLEEVVKKMLI